MSIFGLDSEGGKDEQRRGGRTFRSASSRTRVWLWDRLSRLPLRPQPRQTAAGQYKGIRSCFVPVFTRLQLILRWIGPLLGVILVQLWREFSSVTVQSNRNCKAVIFLVFYRFVFTLPNASSLCQSEPWRALKWLWSWEDKHPQVRLTSLYHGKQQLSGHWQTDRTIDP